MTSVKRICYYRFLLFCAKYVFTVWLLCASLDELKPAFGEEEFFFEEETEQFYREKLDVSTADDFE